MGKTGREGEIVRNFFVGFIVFFLVGRQSSFSAGEKDDGRAMSAKGTENEIVADRLLSLLLPI